MFCPVTYLLFSLGPFRIIAMQSQYYFQFPPKQISTNILSKSLKNMYCIQYCSISFLCTIHQISPTKTNHNLQFFGLFVLCFSQTPKNSANRQDFRAIPPDSPELDRDTTAVAACHARYAQLGDLAEGVDQKGITVPVSRTETGQYLGGDGWWWMVVGGDVGVEKS